MARRSLLGPEERERLFGVPVDRDALVRRYTFDRQDLALIATRRGDTNRLGFAVQLALIRHPGFGLSQTTVVEPLLVAYVADQLGIDPTAFTTYARRAATISDHARILEQALGLRPCARTDLPLMITAAARATWSTDKGEPIAAAIMAALREGGIVPPAPDTIERAGLAGRARARKQVAATLLAGMPDALATRLDALLQTDPTLGRPLGIVGHADGALRCRHALASKDRRRRPKPRPILIRVDGMAPIRTIAYAYRSGAVFCLSRPQASLKAGSVRSASRSSASS